MGAGAAAASRAERSRREQAARVASGADPSGPIASFFASKAKYPSNTQIWHASKDATTGAFTPAYINNIDFGNTPAPKGHYVLNLFYKNRRAASGINELSSDDIEQTDARPTCVCSYAGRIFYSGVEDLGYQGKVWFSMVVRDYLDLGRCYQEQDPTAEDFHDLLATDGGEIQIPDATGIVGLLAVQNGVVILANNGVWSLHGGDAPFTAINYSVDKIHSSGIISASSFTDVNGVVVFCAADGIYAVNNSSTGLQVQSLTDDTIKSFYQGIGAVAKSKIKLVHAKEDRRLYVFYGNDDATDSSLNNILVFDLVLKAWTPLKLQNTSGPSIVEVFDKKNFSDVVVEDDVVVGPDMVVVSGEQVIISTTYAGRTGAALKLVTYVGDNNITFSEFNSSSFMDWSTFNGTGFEYDAYVEVGNVSAGELMRNKQLLYVTSYFNQTETGWSSDPIPVLENQSAATLRGKWGWSDDAFTGRWTAPQDAYKLQYETFLSEDEFNYGYSVVKSKLLIRGQGRAFSLRWEGVNGKDMQLIGWAAPLKVNGGEE